MVAINGARDWTMTGLQEENVLEAAEIAKRKNFFFAREISEIFWSRFSYRILVKF